MTPTTHVPGQQYDGPATITLEPTAAAPASLPTTVSLRGHFDPIDGAFHWYGRLDPATGDQLSNGVRVRVATAYGEANGRLSDIDPWGRFRVSGTGRAPF